MASSPEPDRPVVWIATPRKDFKVSGEHNLETVLGACDAHYGDPIRQLANWPECPWDIKLVVVGGGGIYQGRNVIATQFIEQTKNPFDRLFFVDYDLMPKGQDYVDILMNDLDIVGGLYTTRAENGHWVMNQLPGAAPDKNGLLPVMDLGIGFKCFKRAVFTRVLKDNWWMDCRNDGDHSKRFYSFFNMGPVWDKKMWPGIGRPLTEDYWFDWITRESGFVTYADTKIRLRHLDEYAGKVYPAQFPHNPGALPAESKEL